MSDLIVRPHMTERLDRFPDQYPSEICEANIWKIKDGQSFQLNALRGLPVGEQSTHTVLTYFRVWQGDASPLCLTESADQEWRDEQP